MATVGLAVSGRGWSAEAGGAAFVDFQKAAKEHRVVLSLPDFETTPAALKQSAAEAIRDAEKRLTKIGRVKPSRASYANTVGALDDMNWQVSLVANRAYLIRETSTNAVLRETATEVVKQLEEWGVGVEYREDVFRAVKGYADGRPALSGERAKLLEETLRDYRRAGMPLAPAERAEVERLRKELTSLSTDFSVNINKAESVLTFSRAELDGVPESILTQAGIKTGDDAFSLKANVTWQFLAVMENAKREDTRRKMKTARYQLGGQANVEVLRRMVQTRAEIARRLGYASWADYQIEPKMAHNNATARDFLLRLKEGLQPKFDQEIAALRAMKVRDTGDANARIEHWDWRYYADRLIKEQYQVDPEELRVFFPMNETLAGMFRTYEQVFGVRIVEVEPPASWVEGLRLIVVSDAQSGEPLGALYLDLFPREGKFNHFAQFAVIPGKRLANGRYHRPVAALVCNFPTPTPDRPSLLKYQDVQTLFHEFGHALHTLFTRAETARFSGTSVPRDFVEAPSQMLENWARDKAVLDTFAADYRDPSRKVPADLLTRLERVRRATIGLFYRRQLSFALMDLTLHGAPSGSAVPDPGQVADQCFRDIFLPAPEGTVFMAYFGHMAGYDGGYYGYAWADAIAADLATVFEKAPGRFMDAQVGRRLRDEIYAPGGSRDAEDSIRAFLGRERSIEPFLKSIGVESR